MNAVQQPLQGPQVGKRAWTDAQRAEQAAKLHARKIWLHSTGPRTTEGKITSSRNARLPNYDIRMAERAEIASARRYLRTQKSYMDLLNLFIKQRDRAPACLLNSMFSQLNVLQNELIDLERTMFDGMTFYEVAGLDDRIKKGNIIPFPSTKSKLDRG